MAIIWILCDYLALNLIEIKKILNRVRNDVYDTVYIIVTETGHNDFNLTFRKFKKIALNTIIIVNYCKIAKCIERIGERWLIQYEKLEAPLASPDIVICERMEERLMSLLLKQDINLFRHTAWHLLPMHHEIRKYHGPTRQYAENIKERCARFVYE